MKLTEEMMDVIVGAVEEKIPRYLEEFRSGYLGTQLGREDELRLVIDIKIYQDLWDKLTEMTEDAPTIIEE